MSTHANPAGALISLQPGGAFAPISGGQGLARMGVGQVMTTASMNFTSGEFVVQSNNVASSAWPSANDPMAFPFVLNRSITVAKLGWLNGSAAGDNLDIGIYDTSWTRLVSAGSTAGSGNTAWQWVDVTDTPIGPGRYYLAFAISTITNNRIFYYGAASQPAMALIGVQDSSTDAFPLPNPLTNMAAAAVMDRVPIIGIALRSNV